MITLQAVKELLKHFARYVFWLVLITIIDAIPSYLQGHTSIDPILIGYITLAVGQADKWIHDNKNIPLNGLAPF